MDEWYEEDDGGLADCERYEYELDVADLLLRADPFYPVWLELVERNFNNEVLH